MSDKERKYAIGLMNKELNNFEKGKKQGVVDGLVWVLEEIKRLRKEDAKVIVIGIDDVKLSVEKRLKELEGVQK